MGAPDELSIGEHVVSARALTRLIRQLKAQGNVKAIVLRVDSPGGGAVASDLIWRELRQADEVKPVVVSLSDVAASGGYYIAAGGRLIVAEPGTVTGSIGVVGGKFVLEELLGKLKIKVEVFQRGKHAGILSSTEELSGSERARLRELMQETYDTFVARVAISRGLSVERVREAAGGRPMSGLQAQRAKLVDTIGGLGDAIAAAREAANITPEEEVEIIRLPRAHSLLELLFEQNLDTSTVPPVGRTLLPAGIERASSYLMMLRCLEVEPIALLVPALITIQ
jgi:protease-4